MKHLFDVTIRRTYTPEYIAQLKYALRSDSWDSVVLFWGDTREEAEAFWLERHKPGRYPTFDAMYRDSVVSIAQVSDEDLDARRKIAARYKRCCDLAVLRNCVCSYSITCPDHGTRCHGTHD